MDRKTLVAGARASGWKGSTLAELLDWQDGPDGCDFFEADGRTPVDIEKAWGTKARLTLDAGEVINDLTVETAEQPEQMADDMEDEEDVAKTRRPTVRERQNAAAKRRLGEVHAKASDDYRVAGDRPSLTPKQRANLAACKAYDRRAASGGTVYSDSQQAELAGAFFRAAMAGALDYDRKAADLDIIQKAGTTAVNTLGGSLVPEVLQPDLIRLRNEYGAARKVAGVVPMSDPAMPWPRQTGDLTVYNVNENGEIPSSDITFDNVSLQTQTLAALQVFSMKLLDAAVIDLGDVFSESASRGFAQYEDEAYFNNSKSAFTGLAARITSGGSSTYDSASGGWSGYTTVKLQEWISKLPSWARARAVIVCNRAFDDGVLQSIAMNAGGNTGTEIRTGFQSNSRFSGIPVVHAEVMPSSYVADQVVAYIGAFDLATKFGEWNGGLKVFSSDQRYFEKHQMCLKAVEDVAINIHDVKTDATSGVWGLQD